MLNKHQTTLTKRNQEVKKVLAENQKDVDSYAPFKSKVTEFYDNTAIVDDELPDKDVTGTGATESKDITKEMVAETTANICNLARPYAMEVGNKDLLAGISYSYSDVLGIRDTSLLGSVTAVSNLLMPLVDDDIFKTYLVTKQMLNDMVNGATDFNAMLGDSQLITNGSRVANKNINSALAAANQNIAQLNLLITHF